MTGTGSPAAAWLSRRTHVPPAALQARVQGALAEARWERLDPALADDVPVVCLTAAEELLARLLADGATGTRSRAAAIDLLTADALVTYAFEAASEDPASLPELASRALSRLVLAGDAPIG